MYLEKSQVQSIFKSIGSKFVDSMVIFDTIPESLVDNHVLKSIDKKTAPFKWSNEDSKEIERWNFGFQKLNDYPYISEESSYRIYNDYTYLNEKGYKVSVMKINQNN